MEKPTKHLIAQCFFKEEHKSRLFNTDIHQGFGLEPEVNPDLFLNCPELRDPATRLALTEYACMLWYYRNQDKLPEFFGTTSYRQLDKVNYIPTNLDITIFPFDIVSWGSSLFYDAQGNPISIALQTQIAHPNLNSYLKKVTKVPDSYYLSNFAILANYWLMPRELFISYMDYSWPLVKQALEHFDKKSDPYFTSKMNFGCDPKKAVGYFMERLFIIWSMKYYGGVHPRIVDLTVPKKLYSPVVVYQ